MTAIAVEGARTSVARNATAWLLHPIVLPLVLTVLFLPLGEMRPQATLDPSWRLGMSWVHMLDLHAGSEWVFTFGPLGFLAAPTLVWLPGVIAGIAYAAGVMFAFVFWLYRWTQQWLSRVAAAALSTALVVCASRLANGPLPELAATTIILVALWLVRPSKLDSELDRPWLAILVLVSTAQLLVKFNTGAVGLAACLVVAVARPRRTVNAMVLAGTAVASFAVLWLVAGQRLGDALTWLRLSIDIAAGYSAAMAVPPFPMTAGSAIALFVPIAALVGGLAHVYRRSRAAAVPFVLIGLLGIASAVKVAGVRADKGHVLFGVLIVAALCTAVPWPRPWLGAAVVSWCAVALLLSSASLSTSTFRRIVEDVIVERTARVIRDLRDTVDASARDAALADARQEIRTTYDVPSSVVDELRGADVHAEPFDVSALWAYGLGWQPELLLQSYATYTPRLDDANRDHLASARAPDKVLQQSDAIDDRVAVWESPGYQVELVCRYRVVAMQAGWSALRRHGDRCGTRRSLGSTTVEPGEVVAVPPPSDPSNLVVARFEYPTSWFERLATLLIKPTTAPKVSLDGEQHRFVVGHAGSEHLVGVPDDAQLLHGGLSVGEIGFPGAHGPVRVHFFEIPVRGS